MSKKNEWELLAIDGFIGIDIIALVLMWVW